MAIALPSPLPKPSPDQAYIDVSALDAGMLDLPHRITMEDSSTSEVSFCPSLAFYLKHSTKGEPFVFDLGIRRDTKTLPPFAQHQINTDFPVKVPQDVAESLVKGGVQPEDVKTVLISHLHWDHIGDSSPFKNATFVLGTDARTALAEGFPTDPNSGVLSSAFPSDRTHFLAETEFNASVGPFPRAIDYYKDGSLYIIDASGHMPGHINILARTSPNGSWIFLAADTAHDVRLLSGDKQVGTKFGCMHGNLAVAKVHIDRTAELWRDPSVHVLIAHDWEWYQNHKGTDVFFPGKIRPIIG